MKTLYIKQLYNKWTDGPKYTLVQPTSDPEFLKRATAIGTNQELLVWMKTFPHNIGTFFVDVDRETFIKMKYLRPKLDINLIDDL